GKRSSVVPEVWAHKEIEEGKLRKVLEYKKLQRLELVHTDVYSPTTVASIGRSRYYVTFIDDSSRKGVKYLRVIEYCAEKEIKTLKTVQETPQQNGFHIPEEEWQGKEVSLTHLKVQRSNRESRALQMYSPLANYLLLTENGEPKSYSEALRSK
nr:hypothetical protein [Tanacetum cinerariifolium]